MKEYVKIIGNMDNQFYLFMGYSSLLLEPAKSVWSHYLSKPLGYLMIGTNLVSNSPGYLYSLQILLKV